MRRPVVNHRLVDRVGRLVRKNTGRQTANQLFHLEDPAALHDVVVQQDVLPIEIHLLSQVSKIDCSMYQRWSESDQNCGFSTRATLVRTLGVMATNVEAPWFRWLEARNVFPVARGHIRKKP